jgi:hypothetical protein
MPSSASTRFSSITSSASLGLAAAGGVAVMALIPVTAVIGDWWLLVATFAALLATAGLVVVGFFGLMSETGEPSGEAAAPVKRLAPAGPSAVAERGLRPALGSV